MRTREEVLQRIAECEAAKQADLSHVPWPIKIALGGESKFREQYAKSQDVLIDVLKWFLNE